jgi:PAS domain S-box-containing protein
VRETLHLHDDFPVGCVSTDRHGVVREVNRTAMAMLGQARESRVLGMPLVHWVNQGCRRAYLSHLGRVRRGLRSSVEVDLTMPEGKRLSVNLTSMMHRNGQAPEESVIFNALIEIPEKERAEKDQLRQQHVHLERKHEAIHQEVNELQMEMRERDYYEERLRLAQGRSGFLAEAAGALLRSKNPHEVIERLCHRLLSLVGCDVFFHHLLDETTGRLKLNACAGMPDRVRDRITWMNLGENICGYVALEGEPMVVDHLQQSQDVRLAPLKSEGLRSFTCYPLLDGNDHAIGTLSFGSRTSEAMASGDVDLIATFVEYVASALLRMRNEADLRRSEARYHSLFRNMSEGFALHEIIRNAKGEPVDLVITDVNPAFERMSGFSARQCVGQRTSILFPESDRAFQDCMLKVALTSEPVQEEIYSPFMKRWTKTLIYRPTENRVAMVLVDVTALREAEQREMEALAQAAATRTAREVLDALDEGVMLMDLEGRVHTVNRAFEAVAGQKGDELEGHFLEDVFKVMGAAGVDKLLEAVASFIQGAPVYLDACPLVKQDGDSTLTYIPALSLVRDQAGQVTGAVMSLRDVTAIKRMDAERERYHRDLRLMTERLASTEDRTRHRISTHIHDTIIQTLSLSAIKIGSLRVDLEEGRLDDALHELGTVRTLVTESITESRSLMAELTPPLLHELGLPPALEDLADRLTALYKTPIEVRDDGVSLALDKNVERNLFRCTRELIMNALKHAKAETINVDVWQREGALVIRVSDDGAGFNVPQGQHFINGREGGFGLFSVVENLKNSNGRLKMESNPGQGTTAEITLPLPRTKKTAAALAPARNCPRQDSNLLPTV